MRKLHAAAQLGAAGLAGGRTLLARKVLALINGESPTSETLPVTLIVRST